MSVKAFLLVFFIAVPGTDEVDVLHVERYATHEACQEALEWADFREPYLTLMGEHPDLSMECWLEPLPGIEPGSPHYK